MTRNQKIMLSGVIVAAVVGIGGWIVNHLPKDTGGKMQNVDVKIKGDENVVTITQNYGLDVNDLFEKILTKYGATSRTLGSTEQENRQLKGELAKALERIGQLETQGNRPDATEVLRQLRESGDVSRLQALLIKDRDKHRDALIQRNREISVVAYLRGDIDVAQAATDEALRLEPNDVIALNQKGRIYKVAGKV